jgi:hypothetical protein
VVKAPFEPQQNIEDNKAWNVIMTQEEIANIQNAEHEKLISEKDREIEMLKGQIQMLVNRNTEMQNILENTIIERNHLDNAA